MNTEEIYKEKILDHFKNPRNWGRSDNSTHHYRAENLSCGDEIEIFLRVDENDTIQEVSFVGSGCAICLATASILTEEIGGVSRDRVAKILPKDVLDLLGIKLQPTRLKCALVSLEATQKALHMGPLRSEQNTSTALQIMSKFDVIYDIETKPPNREEDFRFTEKLEVSVVCAFRSDTSEIETFWEEDLVRLEELMLKADRVVGFNTWGFDEPVLKKYFQSEMTGFDSLDMLEAVRKSLGFRIKLDILAKASLGEGKIGTGKDAGVYWQTGDLKSLEKYCRQDVVVTKDLFYLGENTGEISYIDGNGEVRPFEIDWELGLREKKDSDQQSMF